MKFLLFFLNCSLLYALTSCTSSGKPEYPFAGTWRLAEIRCVDSLGKVLKQRFVGKLPGDNTSLIISSNYFSETKKINNCKMSVSGKAIVSYSKDSWNIRWIPDPSMFKSCSGFSMARAHGDDTSKLSLRDGNLVEKKEGFGNCAILERVYRPFL